MLAMMAQAGVAQTVRDLLREAAAAKGEPYIEARNRLVAKGTDIVPELEKVLADDRADWRERAMAGIAIERIAKGDRIVALINHDWRNDPALRDEPGWIDTPGGPFHEKLGEVVRQKVDEAQLNYHYLDVAWKRLRDEAVGASMNPVNQWEEAIRAGNPFVVHVLREGAREDDQVRGWTGYHDFLLRVRDRESLPYLFDVWIKHRPSVIEREFQTIRKYDLWRSEENSRQRATDDADTHLEHLLSVAAKEDEGWIVEKLKPVDLGRRGQAALKRFRENNRSCQAADD
jgi:hypothetical protein